MTNNIKFFAYKETPAGYNPCYLIPAIAVLNNLWWPNPKNGNTIGLSIEWFHLRLGVLYTWGKANG